MDYNVMFAVLIKDRPLLCEHRIVGECDATSKKHYHKVLSNT